MIFVATAIIVLFVAGAALSAWVSTDSFFAGIAGGVAAAVLSLVVGWTVHLGYSDPRDVTCYVEDKDRAKSDGGSDMRIYTRECGVLKVQDLFWGSRFDSADLFSSIEPGNTYEFHITGIRAPFWSVFPNIRSVQKGIES